MSAKAIRELTPMKLLQSLSRMTSPSESIKSLNERFKDSDISVTEFDDSLLTSNRKFDSSDDKETSEEESRSKVDLEQSRVFSEYDESSLLDLSGAQHDNHKFGQSETEEHDEQSFGGSQLEEAGLSTEDFLYEDMVQAINNLKEIMSELRDGQGVHRNLGNALEANLNELNDKTQKRDSLLVEMEAMKEIVDQTNNEMSELKSQLEKRVRSEEEVDAKLADMTEVTDKLRHRIKNKAEQIVHPTGRGFVGSLPSFLLNTLILLGIFAALELFFVGILLRYLLSCSRICSIAVSNINIPRTHEQYDAVFGTMSHGTYYSSDLEHNQSWSVYFARNVWEILVNIFHGNSKGLSVPS
ncbi:hypothetical protein K7432_016113 [Basidiobolus ranarum]|uniref:Uncharacterized protein n=1 Tax=Basidiobolus ranarum TaxID=34480 RepID=A0ABR2WF89_9FUNG